MSVRKNDQVKVDFVSESRTEFSGNHFIGEGVVDRVEDGRVFGRLDDGTPFMCAISDVIIIQQQVIEAVSLQEFERIYEHKEHFKYLKFYPNHNFFDYTEDSPRGAEACHSVNASYQMYINRQAIIDELKKKIEDQIDILKAASKSHAYNYREQNIMLSQADDLEKILRGESQ